MKKKKLYKIYVLSSSSDIHNIRYVGITTQKLSQRLSLHKHNALHSLYRSRPVNKWMYSKYLKGEDIIITQIDICYEENWEIKELQWIKLYKDKGFNLMNIDIGGKGVITADKRSKNSILRSIEGHYKAVVALNLDGSFYKEYKSIVEATKEFNGKSRSSIGNALSGFAKSAFNHLWIYKQDYDTNKIYEYHPWKDNGIKIYQFDFKGNFIKMYYNINNMLVNNKYSYHGIKAAIKNKTPYHGTYLSYLFNININDYKYPYKYKISKYEDEYLFKSLLDIAKFLDTDSSTICTTLKKENPIYKGWKIEKI